MSLQVWLPLNGNLQNKGLNNINFTNNSATIDTSGKIGSCYYFNGSGYIKESTYDWTNFNTSEFSLCCWYKEPSPVASGNSQIICIGTNSGWNNIRIGLLRRTSNGYPMFSVSDGSSAVQYNFTANSFDLDVWNHIVVTYKEGTCNMYLNGQFHKTFKTTITPVLNSSQHLGIGAASNGAEKLTGYLNDIRIYDHCLSPQEVKEISQGLILHYPLNDNSIQVLDNYYNYPTFNTSSANGGWSHWGRSGSSGTYGQNTNHNYIYRPENNYSHWVSNASTATGEYLLYQSPEFEGGVRSLQCICKEENGGVIDETVVFPTWNARNGGVPLDTWTSITSLKNGFYLCKCEGIQQNGSNNLIGFYTKPGKKVYFSQAYVENDKSVCSDIFFPTNTVYDISGFGNNGVSSGDITVNSDTPKYSVSTHIGATNAKIYISNFPTSGFGNSYTFAWWAKVSNVTPMHWGFSNGIRLNGLYTGRLWNTGDGSNNPLYKPGTTTQVSAPTINTWHHWVMTGDGSVCKVYQDGEFWGQAKTYKSISGTSIYINGWDSGTTYSSDNLNISDFRIYATVLSAEDVKSLYNNKAYIDENNIIHGEIRG